MALVGYVIYFSYALAREKPDEEAGADETGAGHEQATAAVLKPILLLAGTAALIYVGAQLTIQAVIALAALVGLGTGTIAASAVALGTSLPEVAVTVVAIRQGRAELAIGNILGSNIFNAFAVIGITGLAGSLAVSADLIAFALPMMMVATLLAIVAIMEQELTKWEGWLLLLFYLFFLGSLFGLV
jgi:cation:H+ antiporter